MWLGGMPAPVAGFTVPARKAITYGLVAAGASVAVEGVVSFRVAKTTVNPVKPETASALVMSGIYRVTPNFMDLGALIVLIGWAALVVATFSSVDSFDCDRADNAAVLAVIASN